ncbi:RNA polymerase-associated factor [Rhizophlyctis rosea]|uniref:RNA polymerase-associated factor n=1 Tax=Rhizophlyctis rosea TaxID=64517 RepID=A0AAD5SFW5_9FUNG|nr:RNA polymerase-associated factor [Rhizophlyctis rosea]
MSRDNKQQEKKVPGNDWAYKYKFKNDLPDIPFDPKLLEYPFPVDRIYRYQHDPLITQTTLAISGRDLELGVPVAPFKSGWLRRALQQPDVYDVPKELDEADRFLLEDEAPPPTKKQGPKIDYKNLPSFTMKTGVEFQADKKKKTGTIKFVIVSWSQLSFLMLTIISPRFRYVEEEEEEDDSQEGQLRAIEKSFEHARDTTLSNLRHPKKSTLKALEIVPVFPNFDLWTNPYALVNYDGDIVQEKSNAGIEEKDPRADTNRSGAVLKSMESAHNTPYVALYFPTDETTERKGKGPSDDLFGEEESDEEEQLDEYTWVRDYEWTQMDDDGKVIFEVQEGKGAYWRPFEGQYRLKRKRGKVIDDTGKPVRIKIGKREETHEELENRKEMERALQSVEEQDVDAEGELEDTPMEEVEDREDS